MTSCADVCSSVDGGDKDDGFVWVFDGCKGA